MNDPSEVVKYSKRDLHEEGEYTNSDSILDEFGRSIDVRFDDFFGTYDVVEMLSHLTNEQAVVVLLMYARFTTKEIAKTLHFHNKKKVYYIVEQVRKILSKQI